MERPNALRRRPAPSHCAHNRLRSRDAGRDGQIRTADLSLRRRPLYPSELRPRILSLLILKYFSARRVFHSVISAGKLDLAVYLLQFHLRRRSYVTHSSAGGFEDRIISAGIATGSAQALYSNLSRVIGRSRTRFPVALKTAFAIAAATPVMPISPIPRAPRGACRSGMPVNRISIRGTSRLTGT